MLEGVFTQHINQEIMLALALQRIANPAIMAYNCNVLSVNVACCG